MDPVSRCPGRHTARVREVFGNPSAPDICIDCIEIEFLMGFTG